MVQLRSLASRRGRLYSRDEGRLELCRSWRLGSWRARSPRV